MNSLLTAPGVAASESRPTDILAKQRAAFLHDGPPPLAQRKADLWRLKTALLARRGALAAALNADFGNRSPYETALLDIVPVVDAIRFLYRNLKKWMKPQRRGVPLHFQLGKASVVYQPRGVVGIMSPWNLPVSVALMPLATAIAAGNRVMLKPSEFSPATNEVLIALLRDVFSEEQVAIVTGDAAVGAEFASLPFDHLIFTGNAHVGRSVMRSASENLVPVTLELGGKSPAMIEQGYSLQQAANSIAFGRLINAGQACIAPDYALVHEKDIEPFVNAYMRAVYKLYPNGMADSAYTSIINAKHYARLNGLIADARQKGARVIEIGTNRAYDAAGMRKLPPTLVLNTRPDMALMQQEIFGPILPIVPYHDIDDAIEYVNARPRPLALYLFGHNESIRRQVLERTTSGNVTINDTMLNYVVDCLPFGGIGASGMGVCHGEEGFRALSHAKGVFEQSRRNFTGLLRAPFGRIADAVLAYLLR